MKVAILTQPLNTNYGSILQAWALQQVLIGLGHVPTTVNRQYDQRARLAGVPGKAKRFLQDAALAVSGRTLYHRHIPFIRALQDDFIRSHIQLSPLIRSDADLRRYFKESGFDAIVVGSDQVWRPWYSPRLETYFLDFVEELGDSPPRRVAYAASFGVDKWEFSPYQTSVCGGLLGCFDAVSVREDSGIALCSDYLGVEAELVLDPTLLLAREDYIQAFCSDTQCDSNGVLTYILDGDDEKTAIVSEVERRLMLRSFSRQPRASQHIIERGERVDYQFPPTDAWVRGFHEAKFVVTDSFHGTVMALLFEKPFIAIANSSRGSTRFHSLLRLVGQQDRLVELPGKVDLDQLLSPIDFEEVRSRLSLLRTSSVEFLRANL